VLREAFLLQSWLDHLRPRERVTESEPRRNLRSVRIESRIILNRSVRSEAAAPERPNFETRTGSAYRKVLNSLDSDNLTKTAVVQLRQRKASRRDEKWPKMGPQACPRGSEEWPQKPAFCAIPAGDKRRKKNVPTGGGKLTRRKHSFRAASRDARVFGLHAGGLHPAPSSARVEAICTVTGRSIPSRLLKKAGWCAL
jgi:hypothetical protein